MKLENKNLKQLKDSAWKNFSVFIRQRGADWRGYNRCVTCNKKSQWKELDAGHFIHGSTKMTYFDERNVHPQCRKCNNYLSGNLRFYERFMQKTYGNKVVMELERKAKKTKTWGRKELIEIIKKYEK